MTIDEINEKIKNLLDSPGILDNDAYDEYMMLFIDRQLLIACSRIEKLRAYFEPTENGQ